MAEEKGARMKTISSDHFISVLWLVAVSLLSRSFCFTLSHTHTRFDSPLTAGLRHDCSFLELSPLTSSVDLFYWNLQLFRVNIYPELSKNLVTSRRKKKMARVSFPSPLLFSQSISTLYHISVYTVLQHDLQKSVISHVSCFSSSKTVWISKWKGETPITEFFYTRVCSFKYLHCEISERETQAVTDTNTVKVTWCHQLVLMISEQCQFSFWFDEGDTACNFEWP